MNEPERQIMSIMGEAVEYGSPEERAAFLEKACAGDADRRARVEALLRAYEAAGNFLQGDSPSREPVATVNEAAREPSGAVIGPYKLIEPIGEGGMGTVWMAQQTEPVKRLVAVKLIKAGMDSAQVIARFEAERQALALMDHPNIARVLDAGTTDAGRPYFVMDLVKGVPITKFCDEHRLTPRQRLELFLPVCRAVQHAHPKGIIHRDLKPSNVLVALYDGKPVPKVIDFGVAKAAGHSLTDKTLVTGFGNIVGTLEYMSPEQAQLNQLDIDTRSDVYSLGVLLYELLAGSPPFSRQELEKAGVLEMLRVIREQEPSRPSTKLSTAEGLPTLAANRGTEPAKLTRLVRGELDWIVMKALEKDRNRRYETANGFAMDVQRYLADEPVLACPPSVGYRLKKFARRNKAALAVASVVAAAVLLVVGSVGYMVRDRVAERTQRMTRVASQVELILQEVERLEKEQKWPEALETARRAQAVLAGAEADTEVGDRVRQVVADLEMVARLEEIRLSAIERDPNSEGGWKPDNAGVARRYAAAFRDYGVDLGALPAEQAAERLRSHPSVALPLAAALDHWGTRQRWLNADKELAKRLWAVAGSLDPDPWRLRVRQAISARNAPALLALAESPDTPRQPPQSQVILAWAMPAGNAAQAIALLERASERHPDDFWIHFDLGRVNSSIQPKRLEAAIRHYTTARALRPRSSAVWNNLGLALHDQKKLDEAIECYKKAIEFDAKNVNAHSNLGNALREQMKPEEAIACYKKAIELDPKYASPHVGLGIALRHQKKPDEAIACFQKAIELDPRNVYAHTNLGVALADQNKFDEAITWHKKAIELDPKCALAHTSLGIALANQEKLDEAIAEFRKAIELDPKSANARYNFGVALMNKGQDNEAANAYREAIRLQPDFAAPLNNLIHILKKQGKLQQAIAALERVIELEPNHAPRLDELAWLLATSPEPQLRDAKRAVQLAQRAVELEPKHQGYWRTLGVALKAKGDLDGAAAAYRASAAALENKNPADADSLYNAACYRALTAEAQTQPKSPDATRLAKEEADRAMAWLTKALAAGFADFDLLDKDTDLDSLRDRADFRKLLADVPPLAKASYYIRLSQWDKATAEYAKADWSRPLRDDAFAYACLFLMRGDSEGYHRFCQLMIQRAVERKDSAEAYVEGYVLARSCAMARKTPVEPARAVEWANQAVVRSPNPWVFHVLGLAQYRAGQFDQALQSFAKAMNWNYGAGLNSFGLALVHHRLGHPDEARRCFDKGIQWLEREGPPSAGGPAKLQPQDWLEAQLLRREAEELLNIKRSP